MLCALIFRGLGLRISKMELEANDNRAVVLFQKCGWTDAEFCMARAKRCYRKEGVLTANGCGMPLEQQILLADVFHGQTTDKFKKYLLDVFNTLPWLLRDCCTNDV